MILPDPCPCPQPQRPSAHQTVDSHTFLTDPWLIRFYLFISLTICLKYLPTTRTQQQQQQQPTTTTLSTYAHTHTCTNSRQQLLAPAAMMSLAICCGNRKPPNSLSNFRVVPCSTTTTTAHPCRPFAIATPMHTVLLAVANCCRHSSDISVTCLAAT